jgi:hypothetical protein
MGTWPIHFPEWQVSIWKAGSKALQITFVVPVFFALVGTLQEIQRWRAHNSHHLRKVVFLRVLSIAVVWRE